VPQEAAAPIGWALLVVASSNADARTDPDLADVVQPLQELGGPATAAGQQLQVVLAPAQPGRFSSVDGSNGQGGVAAVAPGPVLSLEDLQIQGSGGRHDNDDPDFRSIKLLPTADEVSSDDSAF
jgi:hypothetical protein